jgi:hypothetical protein
MGVTAEMHNTGDPGLQRDVVAIIERAQESEHKFE